MSSCYVDLGHFWKLYFKLVFPWTHVGKQVQRTLFLERQPVLVVSTHCVFFGTIDWEQLIFGHWCLEVEISFTGSELDGASWAKLKYHRSSAYLSLVEHKNEDG